MQPTDYYRPLSETLTAVSIRVASCLAIASVPLYHTVDRTPTAIYAPAFPAGVNLTSDLYTAAMESSDEVAQIEAIEAFAGRLLAETVETPQAAVDLLNERFWDLV